METPQDPREIITPDAFSVAPELLGKPLATPWRRGAAMAIDLVAISLLTRTGGFFLGLAASFFFLRLAYRSKGGRFGKRKEAESFVGFSKRLTRWASGSAGQACISPCF